MNKKITALLVAAAITTGMGGYGTYAYFNGITELDNNVSITMGEIKVTPYWAADGQNTWNSTSKVSEVIAKDGGQTLSFENVKPGDTFERDIMIANYGTLNAKTVVTLEPTIAEKLGLELVAIESSDKDIRVESDGRIWSDSIAPGGWIRATVKVTVPTNA
ncbi:MAG: TasA family protein, partial [Clostridium sp.]